jgi:acetate kinase
VRILVVNAGSSSLKLRMLAGDDATVAERELAAPRARVEVGELRAVLREGFGEANAVGHRIVHGGERFREAVLVDAAVERELRRLSELAPLHQPKSLAALDAVSAALPQVPAVACFDTAFHATLPPPAFTYALPTSWRERWGVRRYGFHGLSHAWVARRAPEVLGRPAGALRIVSCHLGAGASLCAIRDGRSIDTTMGFTPLEGLVMATRSGSVDPGLLLWLLENKGLSEHQLAEVLEHESGLRGLAETADMREVIERAADGEPVAKLAFDVYVHRLRGAIAAMAAALQGLDVLVFTGGVGEHAGAVRASVAAGLDFLGVQIDGERNRAAAGDTDLTARGARVQTLLLEAREDLEIALQVRRLLGRARGCAL